MSKPITPGQHTGLRKRWSAAAEVQGFDVNDRDLRLDMISRTIGRRVDSTKDLTQPEISKVFRALEALARPEDLDAQVGDVRHREKPDQARRDQLLRGIRYLAGEICAYHGYEDVDEYIRGLSRDVHGTVHWSELPIDDSPGAFRGAAGRTNLVNLRNTLSNSISRLITLVKREGWEDRRGWRKTRADGKPYTNAQIIEAIIAGKLLLNHCEPPAAPPRIPRNQPAEAPAA